MTEQQLIYLTAIVECGSYSEAALELNISQSTISKQIASLEDELGVKMFDRSTRKAKLTADGEALFPEAAAILSQIKSFKANAEKIQLKGRRRLEVIALPFVGNLNFYVPVFTFEDSHPGCEVRLYEMEETELYKRMSTQDYDVAIVYFDPEHMDNSIRFFPTIESEMVAAVHKSHPLANEKFITPEMLNNVDVMTTQSYNILNHIYELYFRKNNSQPHIIFRSRPQTLLAAATAKKSIALVDRLHASIFRTNSDIILIPFSPSLKSNVGIAVSEDKADDPLIQELIEALSKI